jgi:hypothetical protein
VAAKRQRERIEKRCRHFDPSPAQHTRRPVEDYSLADRAERLAYTRKQAAEALDVSVATLDRRIVPALNTVKTPWGTRLIPVRELERFLEEHTEIASVEFSARRRAGRRPSIPPQIVERIRREHASGESLADIARRLTAEGVPTAHGGRRWWPSTIRSTLTRSASA